MIQRDTLAGIAAREPASPADLPRRWPVTRTHVKHAFAQLRMSGLIEQDAGGSGFRLTDLGNRVLADEELAGA